MRQRAMIAMALSCNPSLLIADEPTTALDVTVQAQILELIQRLRQDFGSSVILITHDMGVVATVSDRVMVMYAGIIAERGPKPHGAGPAQPPLHAGPAQLDPADAWAEAVSPALDPRQPAFADGPPGRVPVPAALRLSPTSPAGRGHPCYRQGAQEASCYLAENGLPDWAV